VFFPLRVASLIYPGDKTYALEKNITVLPLADMGRIRDFSKAP